MPGCGIPGGIFSNYTWTTVPGSVNLAESERMRANAQALGEMIRKEDGLGKTVNWVQRFLV